MFEPDYPGEAEHAVGRFRAEADALLRAGLPRWVVMTSMWACFWQLVMNQHEPDELPAVKRRWFDGLRFTYADGTPIPDAVDRRSDNGGDKPDTASGRGV